MRLDHLLSKEKKITTCYYLTNKDCKIYVGFHVRLKKICKEVELGRREGQVTKGKERMPRHQEAKKAVIDCEKLRGAVK